MAQTVNNLPAMQETWVWSLSQKGPLEKEWLSTPVFLPGEIHRQWEPGGLQSMGSQRIRHDWLLTLSLVHINQNKVSSVQFSCSVLSDSLWPQEPQHSRLPCLSPIPRVHPNPCPLSRWCHPTISSSVIPFSSCPQSLSISGSFQMSQLFTSGG